MYTVKNWETIKGKKFGQKPKNIEIDKIYLNIEKIVSTSLLKIKNDMIKNDDDVFSGAIIDN